MDQNQIALLASGRVLPVMEEFYSLQGEGFHTGEPAWFIRIGGCDVGCSWCDVKESWNASLYPPLNTDDVVERALQCQAGAVIITGGEPLLYNLDYLCHQLLQNSSPITHDSSRITHHASRITPHASRLTPSPSRLTPSPSRLAGIRLFLETSGSQPLSGSWDWICLSPKQEWPPLDSFYQLAHELKVIIYQEDDFRWAEDQAHQMNAGAQLFLQPEWSQHLRMLPVIIRYIQDHPHWRLSLQTHKYIGIP